MKPTKNWRKNANGDFGFPENIAAPDSRKEWYSPREMHPGARFD
jgi:hypothetical protein